LNRDIQRADQSLDDAQIFLLTREGGIQIHYVEAVAPFLFPTTGKRQRVVGINLFLFQLALAKPDHLTVV
jgi:hypothetical protein